MLSGARQAPGRMATPEAAGGTLRPAETWRGSTFMGQGLQPDRDHRMFKSASKDKMSTTIIRQVREAILHGELKPGESLPPEKDLIVQFGVSKHTLREALRALEGMGFISIRRGAGGGPVVSEVDMETTRESVANFLHFQNVSIQDLSDVRKIIEPYLARRAAETFTPQDMAEFLALHDTCKALYDQGQSLATAKEEVNFHVFLAKQTHNPILVLVLDFVNSLLKDVKANLQPGMEFSRKVLDAHQEIVDAIQARDGEAAARHMLAHIREVESELEAMREPARRPKAVIG